MKTVKERVAAANARVAHQPARAMVERYGEDHLVFVDLRDIRELEREGKIPGAYHAPRGMLEFWIDPTSPYAKPIFQNPKTHFVFYCASGWRSALAAETALEMGLTNSSHIEDGFGGWRKAGGAVEAVAKRGS